MAKESKTFPSVSFDEFEPTTYERWKEEAVASLKGASFEKKLFTKTYEGITLSPIYTKADVEALDGPETFPGAKDFLRGAHSAGYLEAPWGVAQAVNVPCADGANKVLKEELAHGADTINLKLDSAVLAGEEEMKRDGVPLRCRKDLDGIFAGVDLKGAKVQIGCGASVLPVLSLFRAWGDVSSLTGCIGGDPLGTLAANGKLPAPLNQLYDELAECVKYAAANAPGLRTVLVDVNVYANGGASAVSESACALATAREYLCAMLDRGIDIDTAAKSLRFSFSLGSNFFMEIAKLRAIRVAFARMVAAFGGSEEAQKISVFARTSAFTMTKYDPYVNILRTTTEVFSGVVGGIDALEVAPLDEPIGPSDEQTRRIARNQQTMMKEEFNLLQPVDPAGGSWYVETLTAQLGEAVWAAFQDIEAAGGMYAALQSGKVQADIQATLEQRFKKLDTRADRAVGTNMYANMTEKPLVRETKAPAEGCDTKCKKTATEESEAALKALAAASDKLEAAVKAAAAYSRLCDIRASLGKPGDVTVAPVAAHRWTEKFEALRARTEAYEEKTGKTVKIFLANMGPIPQHKARADFSCGFFEVAHFEMLRNDGFQTVEEAADAAAASGAGVTVICSTDATYPELVPPLAKLIKSKCPDMMVLLAGAPAADMKNAYIEAGVDDFISVTANCYEILERIQRERGIC